MKKSLIALAIVLLAVALGIGLGYMTDSGGHQLLGFALLPALAGIAFAVQWLVYLPSFMLQTEKFYDLTGSATYLLLVLLALACVTSEQVNERAWLLASMVVLWAVRLGSFLFRRVRKAGKDGRFDEIKTRWSRFLVAWTIQGLWVFLTLLAALIAISAESPQPLGFWALLGSVIWLAGFACEAIADAQKSAFNARPENAGRFVNCGLWRWSRHPNYFGEILLWTGVAIIAAPTFIGWQWLGLISPLFVTLLLTRVSGIPLLEQRAQARWGDDPEYQRYCRETPVLIPRPPSPHNG